MKTVIFCFDNIELPNDLCVFNTCSVSESEIDVVQQEIKTTWKSLKEEFICV